MKVKDFKFKDIKTISNTVTQLDLEKDDIKNITNVLTGAQDQLLATEQQVESYLLNNVEAKERKELYQRTDGDLTQLREYALEHKGVDPNADLFEVILKLVGILADKFDVLAEFIAYYLEDYELKDVMEFDEEESVEAIMAVFTHPGFVKFFSRLFNSK